MHNMYHMLPLLTDNDGTAAATSRAVLGNTNFICKDIDAAASMVCISTYADTHTLLWFMC